MGCSTSAVTATISCGEKGEKGKGVKQSNTSVRSSFRQALEAGLGAWRRLSEARGPVLRRGSVLQAGDETERENEKTQNRMIFQYA